MGNASLKSVNGSYESHEQLMNVTDHHVSALVSMGFRKQSARKALQEAHGNIDGAVEVLLKNSSGPAARSRREINANGLEKSRNCYSKQSEVDDNLKRVTLICNLLADYPTAVDLFVYIIDTILNNPGVSKYRELKVTNLKFQKVVMSIPDKIGISFLLLCGFRRSGDWLVLTKTAEDPHLLRLAQEVLQGVRTSSAYLRAREQDQFDKMILLSVESASMEEKARRDELNRKVPKEPEAGVAATTRITVYIGENVIQRRFYSDDVLMDVVNWLGSSYNSVIPDKVRAGSWTLVDKTLYTQRVLDTEFNLEQTLQGAGMWPGAELLLRTAEVNSCKNTI